MRPVREITAIEENVRVEDFGRGIHMVKRDPVQPEPVGTIVLLAFRVTGYDADCDGSLMARLEHIDKTGDASGWNVDSIGLHHESELVVTSEELAALFEPKP